MNTRFVRLGTTLAVVALAALPVSAAIAPAGDPFQVGFVGQGKQVDPVAAYAADGTSLVAWENLFLGIVGQRYDAAGQPFGGNVVLVANDPAPPLPFRADLRFRRDASLVAVADGFLLFYTEELVDLRSEPFFEQQRVISQEIKVQRFASSLRPEGGAVRISQGAGLHRGPVALGLGDGAAVVWGQHADRGREHGLLVRRVAADGTPAGPAVEADDLDVSVAAPELVAAADGGFLVSFEASDGSALGGFARRFGADGNPLGASFALNGASHDQQRRPALAPRPNGGFLAVWEGATGEERRRAIYGRFLDADGNPTSDDFRISAGEGYAQLAAAVAPTPDGGFLVTWRGYLDGLGYGVSSVELDPLGEVASDEVWINTKKIRKTAHNTIAADGTGGYLIAWEGFVRSKQVVFARRVEID